MVLVTASPNGLSDLYGQRNIEPTRFAYFEPTHIADYPALYADSRDRRSDGLCLLRVGVTDKLYLQILVRTGPGDSTACDLAARTGEAVVATFKKGK